MKTIIAIAILTMTGLNAQASTVAAGHASVAPHAYPPTVLALPRVTVAARPVAPVVTPPATVKKAPVQEQVVSPTTTTTTPNSTFTPVPTCTDTKGKKCYPILRN